MASEAISTVHLAYEGSGRTGPKSGPWAEDGSETGQVEGPKRRRRRERELEKAWEMKRSNNSERCRVSVRPRGPDSESIYMDMDEVKACRELGLELPCDWTVEIPTRFSEDTGSVGESPVGNWSISGPGDDPKDVKARLKAWAHAVALASASSLSG
ncbi:uncharacterized protein A4U43_C05F2480 [Asparagus officinalis]|uniref:Uncharacterized protein n=1 Tax=Asparagus officinalis TaxID=4686 RepID=A0A5P1ERB8_ASPOF|nr:uncharacterized protein LOC109843935 [Asparagus officinalis]ONK67667.1 uncharacterized protein A4U43_C05F2480 [Asparagus officinalis]